MQASQILTRPKIRIVVFASGWNPKQEYDNNLVKKLQSKYDIDVISYDQNTRTIKPQMSYATAYNYTVGGNTYVKRKAKNLLNADEMQKVKKELNDNANQYEHTVYINGFGSEDEEKFHESYKDILTEGQDHTCLNWCTCCQAPQEYRKEPIMTHSNIAGFGDGKFYIKYDESSEKFKNYDILNKKFLDGEIPEEYREHCDLTIKNKKLNADFSPELVDDIYGKIKQKEQQNVSQLDMSKNIGEQNQRNIPANDNEQKGWFHKAVGVPFRDYISCCKSNPDNYNMNI